MGNNAEKIQTQLKQLYLEEKVSLLSGSGFATTAAIPRLGIPSLKVSVIIILAECFVEFQALLTTWCIILAG